MNMKKKAGIAGLVAAGIGAIGGIVYTLTNDDQSIDEKQQPATQTTNQDHLNTQDAEQSRRQSMLDHAHRSVSAFVRIDWHQGFDCLEINEFVPLPQEFGMFSGVLPRSMYNIMSFLSISDICNLKPVSKQIHSLSDVLLKDKNWLRACCIQGIHSQHRPEIWTKVLLNSTRDPELYNHIYNVLSSSGGMPEKSVAHAINLDIPRTFPELPYFRESMFNRERLSRLLNSYAIHDPNVGYMQGMNFVVGFLLQTLEDEMQVFWFLECLMKEYDMEWMYMPNIPQLPVFLWQLDKIIELLLPDLYAHFQDEGISISIFSVEWFATLFTYVLPFETVRRIWDLVLVDGLTVIFRVGLTLILRSSDKLMTLNFEGLIRYLKDFPDPEVIEPNCLLQDTVNIPVSQEMLDNLEDQYIHEVINA